MVGLGVAVDLLAAFLTVVARAAFGLAVCFSAGFAIFLAEVFTAFAEGGVTLVAADCLVFFAGIERHSFNLNQLFVK